MKTKKVWVCINENEFTLDFVKQDIEDEGYNYLFHFNNGLNFINNCDEFWCYGDCTKKEAYRKAVDLGVDIWQMY